MSLKQIYKFPNFHTYLLEEKWRNHFTEATRKRAQGYTTEGKISDIYFDTLDKNEFVLYGESEGSRSASYELTVYVVHRKRSGWSIQTDCSCPIGYNCKHAAALLYTVKEQLKIETAPQDASSNPAFDRWLSQLMPEDGKSPKKKAKPNNTFLAYCIQEKEYHNGLELKLHVGRRLKSGDIRIDFSGNASPKLEKPPKYFAEDDYLPVITYNQLHIDWYSGVALKSAAAHKLLLEALKTGRLFHIPDSGKIIPVAAADALKLTPTWITASDGSAIPDLGLPENSLLIATDPPFVICPQSEDDPATLRPLESKNFTPKQLLHWEKGPTLSPAQVAEASDILKQKAPKLPAPVQVKTETLAKSKPVPQLHLHRANPFTHGGLHLSGQPEPIIATLSFQYHGKNSGPDLTQPPPSEASFSYLENGTRYTIPRDIDAELDLIQPLFAEHQLQPAVSFDPRHIHTDHESALLPDFEPGAWDIGWAHIISQEIPALRENGWEITIDSSAELDVQTIGDDGLQTDLAEDPDHGIDWFQFQASYLTPEGKEQSILPLLGPFLQEADPETIDSILENASEDDKTILRDPENPHAYLSFPSIPLYNLTKNIFELFGKDSPEEPIHRLQAADIADNLELDSSQTLKDLAALGHNLKNITSLPKPKIPKTVKADLRDYQVEGFHWMQFLARHGLHGVLADDMGLGKTLQTLAHLQAEISGRRSKGRPSLVIAPTSVVGNWKNEAAKFTPDLKVLVLHGPDRKEHFSKIDKHHLVLTTYPLLVRDFDELAKHDFHLLALDEAQYIKNPAAKAAQCACKLKAAHRVALSGTPIENHLGELWSQMRFLMPGLLGSSEAFRKHFRTPIEKHHDRAAQKTLNARVAPLILRRTKENVATELPPKTEIIHKIPLNKKQIDLYETIRAAMDSRIRDAISSKGLAKSQIIVLDALLKLRQICCHPQLLKLPAAKKISDSAKLDFLTKDLLPTLLDEKRKILLFSTFTSMLKLIEDHLDKEKIPFAKITGQTKKRQAQIDKFQEGDTPVFLISLKAGGTGLNLTAADTVIHYDPWWNPAAENQATDRAYRIGQDKPVFVHKLICEGSIEQRIQDLQNQKTALVDALFTDDTSKLRIDQSTLQNLLAPIE